MITGSKGGSIPSFLKILHTAFQSGCTNFQLHQQRKSNLLPCLPVPYSGLVEVSIRVQGEEKESLCVMELGSICQSLDPPITEREKRNAEHKFLFTDNAN